MQGSNDQLPLGYETYASASQRPNVIMEPSSAGERTVFVNPPGHAPVTAQVPRIRRRNRMITSCLECRRRKLKCDKSHPCANCTKVSRDCIFLAPALDTASQLKLTEIKEKMGSLERVLEHDVARNRREAANGGLALHHSRGEEIDFAPIPEDERDLEPSPLAVIDAMYEEDGDDDLSDLGIAFGKLRLTERLGGFFRPKMSDEITVSLTDKKPEIGSPFSNVTSMSPVPQSAKQLNYLAPGPTYIPPSSSFFFSSSGHAHSLIDFLPSMSAADHLVQQYWNCVHPIARLVHRPSFQRRYAVFWQEVQLGIEPVGSLQAIVFAVMFSGVVSMSEDIILRDFGVPKKNLIDNFQQGTETALGRANVLRTTKLETIQAFVMYMIPLCRDQMSRSHSALVGTAIRLAECMGLHRDGTDYGIGPVETHVRRLVWYQLCFLDIRTCEAQGPRPGIREGEFDTKFPLNVDDVELEFAHYPTKSADRWTDMTFALIRMESNEMHREMWFDRPRLEKKQISLTAVLGKIENFKRIIHEKYLHLLDDNIPIQHAAHLVLNILITKMHIMVLHRYHNSVAAKMPDRLRQIILTSGTAQMENAMRLETDPSLHPWLWYTGAIQQYQTAFLLLAEIFTYPMRREGDRIWKCLDFVFEPPLHLSRDDKARLILTEIRDRLGLYRDARKLRAPTAMLQRIGQLSPSLSHDGSPEIRLGPAKLGKLYMPASNHELEFVPATTEAPPGLESGSSESPASVPTMAPPIVVSDLMEDIDWNEWDKLFPPESNTGDLNLSPPVD